MSWPLDLIRALLLSGGVLGLVLAAAGTAAAEPRPISIHTASPGGIYYPIGGAICRFVNLGTDTHGLRCAAQPSRGSVANAAALQAGRADLALMQSDVAADAHAGAGDFAQARMDDLRILMVVHAEPFTLVTRPGTGIQSLADIKGKRVSMGNPGSGQRVAMERIVAALGLSPDAISATGLVPSAQNAALCAGSIDAIVFMAGQPNGLIQEAVADCDGILVPVTGPAVSEVLARYPTYTPATIPGGLYAGHAEPIPTFGAQAVVVARARLPDSAVKPVVAAVFKHFAEFTRLHPVLARLDQTRMATPIAGLTLHPAAAAFYREHGLAP